MRPQLPRGFRVEYDGRAENGDVEIAIGASWWRRLTMRREARERIEIEYVFAVACEAVEERE